MSIKKQQFDKKKYQKKNCMVIRYQSSHLFVFGYD